VDPPPVSLRAGMDSVPILADPRYRSLRWPLSEEAVCGDRDAESHGRGSFAPPQRLLAASSTTCAEVSSLSEGSRSDDGRHRSSVIARPPRVRSSSGRPASHSNSRGILGSRPAHDQAPSPNDAPCESVRKLFRPDTEPQDQIARAGRAWARVLARSVRNGIRQVERTPAHRTLLCSRT